MWAALEDIETTLLRQPSVPQLTCHCDCTCRAVLCVTSDLCRGCAVFVCLLRIWCGAEVAVSCVLCFSCAGCCGVSHRVKKQGASQTLRVNTRSNDPHAPIRTPFPTRRHAGKGPSMFSILAACCCSHQLARCHSRACVTRGLFPFHEGRSVSPVSSVYL